MLGAVDAEGLERFSGCWAAEGAEVLDHGAPHLVGWRMGGDGGREGEASWVAGWRWRWRTFSAR